MKILFLAKRRPQGKDLFTRPYGRFFYIPSILSHRGHEIYLSLLSYQREPPFRLQKNGLTWISESLLKGDPFSYIKKTRQLIEDVKPDWIVGFSDTYYGILAVEHGKRFGIRSAIDAYDNYESYIPWFWPLHRYWRKALSQASLVTAAGPGLGDLLAAHRPDRKAHIVPMAADPGFRPMDKEECRERLGLPMNKKIIGYCGSLYRSRGIEWMFRGLEMMRHQIPDLEIVVTGRKERGIRIPDYIHYLGYLPDESIPAFINSMDILLIINMLSAFGMYSYPVKLYEAMRCQIPVVASDTPGVNWILKGRKEFLARPGDPHDLARKILQVPLIGRWDYGEQPTWDQSCNAFEEALLSQMR